MAERTAGYRLIGLVGTVLATVLSYSVNQSVWWAILHFFCSWLYVVYWVIAKSNIIDTYIKPFIK